MKKLYILLIFSALFIFPAHIFAQLTNGGINAYFGVDGDTRNNYIKYGPTTGLIASDDWFSGLLSGYNVIDTSGASYYYSLLQGGSNISFNKRMSVPLYSKINGKLWLDAVYGRDYVCTSPLFDSTIFSIACKNGDNPSAWVGGTSNTPDKNDLLDVYAHMRRDGTSVYDSLWLFTGVSTVGTSGSRYFDIELYKNNFSYSSGTFTTAGTDAGHTQWKFDASGNIIQTGDMILAVNFTPGSAPVVDVRIWVSNTTFSSVTPAYFNFGTNFDGSTPSFGYASIISKTGATAFGSGISNYSATATADTTYSTPWGTEQSTKNWGTQYLSLQFVEIGLNLTRIGLDPALYSALGLNPCTSLFSDIFFKSRSSNSFVSNMQDFVTPLTFLRSPAMDYSIQPDTLRCNKMSGTIQITNNSTAGYYTWQTTNGGNISGTNTDSSQINLNKPGTYIVSASPAIGCPATRTDTVVVPIDTFPPVASFIAGLTSDNAHLQFYGGDVAASNYPTPFGGSQGLLWDWGGPGGFSSNIQFPVNDTVWGTYQLIVTEKRNGCKDTTEHAYSRVLFFILANNGMFLAGTYQNKSVQLNWQVQNDNNISSYEIERSQNGNDFSKLSALSHKNQSPEAIDPYFFNDHYPYEGNNYYRIKSISKDGLALYSNIIKVNAGISGQPKFYLTKNDAGDISLINNADKDCGGVMVVYNLLGEVLQTQSVQLSKGQNIIKVQANRIQKNSVIIVTMLLDNQLAFAQKIFF